MGFNCINSCLVHISCFTFTHPRTHTIKTQYTFSPTAEGGSLTAGGSNVVHYSQNLVRKVVTCQQKTSRLLQDNIKKKKAFERFTKWL